MKEVVWCFTYIKETTLRENYKEVYKLWRERKFKEKFGNYTRKPLDRFTTKDSYTWNITHNTESTAV